jgi:hypothetical protein
MAEAVPAEVTAEVALVAGTETEALVLDMAEAVQAAGTVEAALLGTAEAVLALLGMEEAVLLALPTAEAALPEATAEAALPAVTEEAALPEAMVQAVLPEAMEQAVPVGIAVSRRRHLGHQQRTALRVTEGRADTARWATARLRPLVATQCLRLRRHLVMMHGPSMQSSSRAPGCRRPAEARRADTIRFFP